MTVISYHQVNKNKKNHWWIAYCIINDSFEHLVHCMPQRIWQHPPHRRKKEIRQWQFNKILGVITTSFFSQGTAYSQLCLTCHTATGNHMPHRITQCYLPLDRGDIPVEVYLCDVTLPSWHFTAVCVCVRTKTTVRRKCSGVKVRKRSSGSFGTGRRPSILTRKVSQWIRLKSFDYSELTTFCLV